MSSQYSGTQSPSFLLRVLLAFGGFGGVVVALLELLQGDRLVGIIVPLVWSLVSVIMLFISRIIANDGILRMLTVILYNFLLFPAIWVAGHGVQGPAILYYLVLLITLVVLIRRNEGMILAALLFTILTIVLMTWRPPAWDLNRLYDSDYQRLFDFIFNMVFAGIIVVAVSRVLVNRINNLERELDKTKTQDNLTGLYNRKRILELLKGEQLRSGRERQNLSVVVFNIRGFSRVISELGIHSAESLVKKIAYVMRSKSRMYDFIGRVHPNSFLSVLPGSSKDDAQEYIRRISEEDGLLERQYLKLDVSVEGKAVEVSNMAYEEIITIVDGFFRDQI